MSPQVTPTHQRIRHMRVAPNPRTLTGWFGASPHGLRFPLRAFLRFPVCPPSSSPSSAFLGFPFVRRSPVCPFGRCLVAVPLRFPSGFPFPWAISTLARPRDGSARVGPGRQGPTSPVLPRPPRSDRAIQPPLRMGSGWAGCAGPPEFWGDVKMAEPRRVPVSATSVAAKAAGT